MPNTLTQWATPIHEFNKFLETSIYAQDSWTINRLTLNLGGRFQIANGWVPAYEVPAGRFAPARQIPRQGDIPNWQDFSTRIGAAYDLFGNGKTALKAFIGKYPRLPVFRSDVRSSRHLSASASPGAFGSAYPRCSSAVAA